MSTQELQLLRTKCRLVIGAHYAKELQRQMMAMGVRVSMNEIYNALHKGKGKRLDEIVHAANLIYKSMAGSFDWQKLA